jgi:hypothetical protein
MGDLQEPFEDVRDEDGGFSIPELKWRELLFVGALRAEGEHFVRDPARPLPPFRRSGLFPEGARLRAERRGRRVLVIPL